jgi:hypothetical protein
MCLRKVNLVHDGALLSHVLFNQFQQQGRFPRFHLRLRQLFAAEEEKEATAVFQEVLA